jgi:hypothetical protein
MAFPRQNRFASAKTFSELQDMYEAVVSPENLHADGERTPEEASALFRQLTADFNARDEELLNAHNLNYPQQ